MLAELGVAQPCGLGIDLGRLARGRGGRGLVFAPRGLIAVSGEAIILASILGVTGIPPTESQAIRSQGDAYREYQKRVSKFLPLPPKRTRSET